MVAKTSEQEKVLADPLQGIEESSLYWHLFCHCSQYKISFCQKPAAEPGGGRALDGLGPQQNIAAWKSGEFCAACLARVGKTCPWAHGCGQCRALQARSSWYKFWERKKPL